MKQKKKKKRNPILAELKKFMEEQENELKSETENDFEIEDIDAVKNMIKFKDKNLISYFLDDKNKNSLCC